MKKLPRLAAIAIFLLTILLSACLKKTDVSVGGNFVYVEGGTFQMGSVTGDFDEEPVHTVTVKSFIMSRTEVTQKEWFEVMGTTLKQQLDMAQQSDRRGRTLSLHGEGDDYPMYYVNWYDAVEYCNKLSLKEGLTPVYEVLINDIICDWNANGYRLPTEAEWEYAAKGGNKERKTFEYSGSKKVGAVAWYVDNSERETKPVGTKAPNKLGLYDMSGNVWEWCWDWFSFYESDAQTGPKGPSVGKERVNRGGGWLSTANVVRVTYRAFFFPSDRSYVLGFRVVRNVDSHMTA